VGHNTVIVLTANPSAGSSFAGWSVGGCGGTGTCSVTLDFYKNVTATFILNTYTVTPSAGANGSISPTMPIPTLAGTTLAFMVTPDAGFNASVSGSCGGSLSGTTYTTSPVFADCTVVASFVPTIALSRVESRKQHAAVTCNVPIARGVAINGNVSTEPRDNGTGHTIVFVFNSTVTSLGGASISPTGTANPTLSGNEVRVAVSGVADQSRATVSVSGVNGSINESVSLGFFNGDVSNSRAINASDISAVMARVNQMLDTSNCIADLNVDGQIKSSDVSTVKAKSGRTLP
jgi:hypothetical protein